MLLLLLLIAGRIGCGCAIVGSYLLLHYMLVTGWFFFNIGHPIYSMLWTKWTKILDGNMIRMFHNIACAPNMSWMRMKESKKPKKKTKSRTHNTQSGLYSYRPKQNTAHTNANTKHGRARKNCFRANVKLLFRCIYLDYDKLLFHCSGH